MKNGLLVVSLKRFGRILNKKVPDWIMVIMLCGAPWAGLSLFDWFLIETLSDKSLMFPIIAFYISGFACWLWLGFVISSITIDFPHCFLD